MIFCQPSSKRLPLATDGNEFKKPTDIQILVAESKLEVSIKSFHSEPRELDGSGHRKIIRARRKEDTRRTWPS